MKLYSLFITTFFILIDFPVGLSVDKKATPRDYIYASYDNSAGVLKKFKIDYLIEDVHDIYGSVYKVVEAILDFYKNNQNLMKQFESHKHYADVCLNEDLRAKINHHENIIKKFCETLEETPKNPVCYKDVIEFLENFKNDSRKMIVDDQTLDIMKSHSKEIEEFLVIIDEDYLQVLPQLKEKLEESINIYLLTMMDHVKNKDKKKVIQKHSAELVNSVKEAMDRCIEDLEKDGILNKNVVIEILEDYTEALRSCQGLSNQLQYTTAQFENYMMETISTIENYGNAKYYIIDDENNKKLLDCDDYIPYFGSKNTETTVSAWQNKEGNIINYVFNGTDENGRKYKRTLIYDISEQYVFEVKETIEYDDEVLEKKFVIEFANTEKP